MKKYIKHINYLKKKLLLGSNFLGKEELRHMVAPWGNLGPFLLGGHGCSLRPTMCLREQGLKLLG
jgi:hypothetical protein